MIGLMFLGIFTLWLGLVFYLGLNIPKWLKLKWKIFISALLIPVLAAAPFVDEVLGMRQFKQLCKERDVVHLSLDANQVKRAVGAYGPSVEVPGYWINIQSRSTAYTDLDSGKIFYSSESLHTKGGRIAGALLMGGEHSCWPSEKNEILRRLNINKLLDEGRKL